MRKKFTRIVCIAAAAALSCSLLAGCGNDGSKTAITVNGEALPYGEALFMLRTNQAEVYYQMMSSGFYSTSTLWDEEYTPEDSEEAGTYGSYFKDSIAHELCELLLMDQKSGEYGVSIDETDIANTEMLADQFMTENADFTKQYGITKDHVLAVLQLTALRAKMKEAMTVDVDTNVSDEEADMTTITYLRLARADEEAEEETADTETADAETAEGEETEEEHAKTNEELLADAEKALELFKTADSELDYDALNELGDGVNEDFFGMSYSYAPDEEAFSEEVLNAVATLKDGEVYDGVIEDPNYFYLVRLDKAHDPDKIAEKKETIINERKNELYEETLHEWYDAAEIKEEEVWTKTTVTDTERYLSTEFLETSE